MFIIQKIPKLAARMTVNTYLGRMTQEQALKICGDSECEGTLCIIAPLFTGLPEDLGCLSRCQSHDCGTNKEGCSVLVQT